MSLSSLGEIGTVKISPKTYSSVYPEFSEKLALTPNLQLIRVRRADVLYSIISHKTSHLTGEFHLKSDTSRARQNDINFEISLFELEESLTRLVNEEKHMDTYFPNVPIIYYEEFQESPVKLTRKFTGVPIRMISVGTVRFMGNHKTNVTNIDEVEDFYEKFVNEHKEYFPQYFGKLPHVKIPASQGRQPRDLSAVLEVA
jgi:hypothetical protein